MTVLGRFMVFVFYIIVILGLSFLINGTLIPESNIEGAWYYASIAYFLVSFLASPFFMKPTDTIASAVTAGALLLTIRIPSGIPAEFAFKTGKSICIVYCVLTILIALIAILLRPRDSLHQETFPSKIAFQLSDRLGRGEIVFSFIFLLSILISLTNRPNLLLLLLILWLFAILLKPHEILLKAISVWKAQSAEVNTQIIGTVRAFENPGIAVVLLSPGKYVEPGSTICILDSHSQLRIGRAVAEYELQDERWMRVLLSQKSIENRTTEGVKLIPKNQLTPNTVFTLDKVKIGSIQIDNDTRSLLTSDEKPLIGFVAEESMIDHIQIELLCQTSDVYEGRIVTTSIRGEQVFYQVIDAATKSEALEKKSSLGYFSVRARKIGRWDESQKRFKSVKWLPQIYAPVYLWRDEPVGFRLEAVGHLPGSSFSVLLNLNIAVTHNTAILGVLGCGKTYLALELIARLVNDRKKVICLDITKQYSSEMRQFYNPERDTQDDATIQASIEELADNVSRNIEEGGNWQRFRDLIT